MEDNSWHLDKKVPIALLAALVVQFAGMMMFIGDVKATGTENTRRITAIESQKVSERLSSLEAKIDRLGSIELKIDRLVERAPPK
jgi:hypothetical protein